jgi:UTP--glucose-1-phosphate uridylyltransferase
MQNDKIITKGVIAVAGTGTRFLPVTKSLPKEMLPVLDKPIVQYVVEEMVAAGITDIILVTRSDKKPLEDYFDQNALLEKELREDGKRDLLEKIEHLHQMANFIYVRQKGQYGNGTPVLNVRSIVGNDPFVFAYGDDLVKADVSFTRQLIENYERNRAVVLGCQEVRPEDVQLYGMMKLKADSTIMEVEDIVEKPRPQNAPSRLAAFGRFVLVPEICEILSELPPGKDNELWLTDAIREYLRRGNPVVAQPVRDGRWFTTGDPLHWLEVTLRYALDREDYRTTVQEMLTRLT